MSEQQEKEIEPKTMTRIDGIWLKSALNMGINRVVSRRDYINKINVFPVPDADTGTNLAFTLLAVLNDFKNRKESHAGNFLVRAADHAIDGARGNSGAIFAQYLQGFSEAAESLAELTAQNYAAAVSHGSVSAQGAIAEPREGTMLSVINDYAHELSTQIDAGIEDFKLLMRSGLEKARLSLANTPNQLEVLKQAGVVDAGAQGFVDLLEGMQDFVENGTVSNLNATDHAELSDDEQTAEVEFETTQSDHRFCTECIVTGDKIDRMALREQIQELDASSLVIAGTKRKARVHVHVNKPAELFLICEKFGEVSSQKADDMHQQTRSAHHHRRPVAVVIDSGADLPESEMERWDVHMVPLRVNFGDRQYMDKLSLTPQEFYQHIRESEHHPQTSQPPPGDFRRQFEFLGSHFDTVLCILISSALSGTYQAAQTAASRSDGNIRIFDTKNASSGQGLIALYAAEAVAAGCDEGELLDLIESARLKTRTYAVIDDLSFAVRGGRLPSWLKKVADFLHLTPVIATEPGGKIKPVGVIFGKEKRAERFASWISKRYKNPDSYRLMVGHCDNESEAKKLRDKLVTSLPTVHSAFLTSVGTAIGAHAGPATLVVGIQEYIAPQRANAAEDWH